MHARARSLLPLLATVAGALILTILRGPVDAGAAPAGAAAAPPKAGQEIWLRDCAVCHGEDGSGSDRGPSVQGSGAAGVDFMVTTGRMPVTDPSTNATRGPVNYEPAEIDALVEYAATIIAGPSVPEIDITGVDVPTGGELFRTNCASCHQMAGQGGILPNGRNVPSLGRADSVQVVEAIRSGPNDMPPFSEKQLDEREVREIAAYVQEIDDPNDRGGWPMGHWGPVSEGAAAFIFGLVPAVLFTRWLGDRNPPPAQEDEIR